MRIRRYLRIAGLALPAVGMLFVLLLAPFTAHAASAHAFVIGSDPIDGSTISTPPRVIRIFFNGKISSASGARVVGPDGRQVNASASIVNPVNPFELDTPLLPPAQLAQGGYAVYWTALATTDGETTKGIIGFNLGRSSTGLSGVPILGPTTSNTPQKLDFLSGLAIAWDWLVMVALTFWLGILVMEHLVLGRVERTSDLLAQARKQARPLQWLCLLALLVGECLALILRSALFAQGEGGAGIDLSRLGQILTQSEYGYLWLARACLLLLAMTFLWWTSRPTLSPPPLTPSSGRQTTSDFGRLRRQVTRDFSAESSAISRDLATKKEEESHQTTPALPTSWPGLCVWLLLASLIVLTYALTGDSAQLAQPHVSAIVLNWIFLVAQGIWLGALAYLGYVALPLLPVVEPDRHADLLTILTRRLKPLILSIIGALIVCLLYLSESSLTSLQQFLNDPYGRTLLVKLILTLFLAIGSVYLFLRLGPRLTRQALLLPVVDAELPARRTRREALGQTQRRLKRLLSLLSWCGAAILLCAAIMNFFAPPIVFPNITYAQTTQTPATPTQSPQTQRVGDLQVTLIVLPGLVNHNNTISVQLTDTANHPITNAQVRLSVNMELMDMGTSTQVVKGGNSTFAATFDRDATFDMQGPWLIYVTIERPQQTTLQAKFTVMIN